MTLVKDLFIITNLLIYSVIYIEDGHPFFFMLSEEELHKRYNINDVNKFNENLKVVEKKEVKIIIDLKYKR